MARRDLVTWAFALTLAGSVLLLLAGLDLLLKAGDLGNANDFLPGQPFTRLTGRVVLYGVIALLAGAALLFVATRLRADAPRRQTWAIAAIVVGAVGFAAATWGPLAAIAGGIVALVADRP